MFINKHKYLHAETAKLLSNVRKKTKVHCSTRYRVITTSPQTNVLQKKKKKLLLLHSNPGY